MTVATINRVKDFYPHQQIKLILVLDRRLNLFYLFQALLQEKDSAFFEQKQL